jgi:hypothetical protein
MGKNVLKSSPLKPVSQYSKHVIDGQLPKLCSVIPISVQNGRRQNNVIHAGLVIGLYELLGNPTT